MVHVIIVKKVSILKIVQKNAIKIAMKINVILMKVNALVVIQDIMEKIVQKNVEIVLLLIVILKMEHVIVAKVHFGEKNVTKLAMQLVQFQAMEHV